MDDDTKKLATSIITMLEAMKNLEDDFEVDWEPVNRAIKLVTESRDGVGSFSEALAAAERAAANTIDVVKQEMLDLSKLCANSEELLSRILESEIEEKTKMRNELQKECEELEELVLQQDEKIAELQTELIDELMEGEQAELM